MDLKPSKEVLEAVKNQTSNPDENRNEETAVKAVEELVGKYDAASGKQSESTTKTTPKKESSRSLDDGLNPDGTVKTPEDQGYTKKEDEEIGDEELKKLVKNEIKSLLEKKESSTEANELNLSNRLIQAGKRNGMDENDIKNLGDKAEAILSKLADNADAVSAKLGEYGRLKKLQDAANPPKTEKENEVDLTDVDDSTKKIIEAFTKKITSLEDKLEKKSKADNDATSAEINSLIDSIFDDNSNRITEFGKTDNLTRSQSMLRKSIWEDADDILVGAEIKGHPVTVEEALDRAISIYEKDNNVKVTDEEIKDREKQRINKPSERRTSKVYKDSMEKAVDAVQRWLDAHP